MRKLKYHEKKLLKKVDFLNWKSERNIRQITILRRFYVQKREDYYKYNKLCGQITHIVSQLKKLSTTDPYRIEQTQILLHKLYDMGIIPSTRSLELCEKISTASFCKRRLPVVLVRLRMAQTLREAVTYIEQGHVQVGIETVNDPAFLVTRKMEDYITWNKQSSIRKKIMDFNGNRDDFDLLE